ncbi:NAD(P)-dependent dehydrogenase, short-chain alcohol dehydrogenase family [Hymenobacter daecheongensis DSM 21074]|uniref:NAD(P)-dependent dehydrogenase, short-chain alcohol dehydrogenase family n=1 Tax=Hymenobacter daecheongensis DSM 21074 TaxID=1121955 RepID=A0A1M6C5W3_9BACT|nr:SDR family oxidoreductase [Hymenobacter daecheongensis]SHI56396.1 NAD(P)-dependent dehydrogenase, short-chain alcohol dehydrogenase family [Hymenobacter daecheongensis DSM 21074]
MKRVLITGANRGLGLELTRQYLERGDQVFAACRHPNAATELQALQLQYPDKLILLSLDVTDEASLAAAHELVDAHAEALDILINNAGILPGHPGAGLGDDPATQRLGHLRYQDAMQVLATNAVGPLLVTQQFLELLKKGRKSRIVNISTGLGSLTLKASGSQYHYSASKAAMNMYMRTLAIEAGHDGLVSIMVDPGWMRTDMGGTGAALLPADSARGIIRLADQLHAEENGSFVTWQGKPVPW